MKAKFIYEALRDILKGKSLEEIMPHLEAMEPNDMLEKCAEIGFLPGVKRALERGADIHDSDDWVLRIASKKGHYDVVELLLKNGADVHARVGGPLQLASQNGHTDVVELLKKYM